MWKRLLLPTLVAVIILVIHAAPHARADGRASSAACGPVAVQPYCHARKLRPAIRELRRRTAKLAAMKWLPAPRPAYLTWRVGQLGRERQHWTRALTRARKAKARVYRSPRHAAWMCIYRHEAANYGWDANTGNGYYGGLQMDLQFQRTYGREYLARYGTADRWPWWAQMRAADRAHQGYAGYGGRGYSPWPNTSRMCGLR